MANIAIALLLAVQQVPTGTGLTSPADGDTTGYWQQRVAYTVVATLDEAAQRVRARGTMRYVNNSPDTLREMYVHQYLNAFRPYSAWSRDDERAGVERFQNLRDPQHAFERFTAPVRVDGTPVVVSYPGMPDSTVARFALPAPLAPGDSITVAFEWEARPSTLPRRQGRRGRHWDLAQWYPKVAVYDRGGWEYNALRPAGEFYGEFGTYDVTVVLPDDQVIGAVGVAVSGDPGWRGANRGDRAPTRNADAYANLAPAPAVTVPAGHKAVRFVARNVHHFAWSASPDYRYEGAVYARPAAESRLPSWDTVAIHVLYQPGDDTTWGGGRVVQRTLNAMRWLELIYGAYPYPQMTVLHRIEGGGTEFPMMQMNGSPSQGLILHEGGHIWTYGILANNEWRSGWMDEGLTSYQSEWAQGLTQPERVRQGIVDRFREPTGYRAHGRQLALSRPDAIALQRALTDLEGNAEPIGTVAHEFRDFGTYNDMIYSRAQVMYSQLRDELGDSLFVGFLHDYYARWALKHVDERAMRASAERMAGRDLGWFFRQWVHETGVLDYALTDVRRTTGEGGWVTEATIERRGEYHHSMPVGVRTRSGWTIARADATQDRQVVRIVTGQEPLEVRIDPHHFTWDWDRRNDVTSSLPVLGVDWPFLTQADRERSVLLFRPMAWYSEPGGATPGLRARSSYLQSLDQWELGVAVPVKAELPAKVQGWARITNPYFGFASRPWYGFSAGVSMLDDVFAADLGWRRLREVGRTTSDGRWALTYANAVAPDLLPELWDQRWTVDLSSRLRRDHQSANGDYRFSELGALAGVGDDGLYAKGEYALGNVFAFGESSSFGVRGYFGYTHADSVVGPRALYLAAADPISTLGQHWWRPRDAILKQGGAARFLPLGGAALRGYHWSVAADMLGAANSEWSQRVARFRRASHDVSLSLTGFADLAMTSRDGITLGGVPVFGPGNPKSDGFLVDAGVGLKFRGRIYDRNFTLRFDSPFYVSEPMLAVDLGRAGADRLAPRLVISVGDIW